MPNARRLSVPEAWREIGRRIEAGEVPDLVAGRWALADSRRITAWLHAHMIEQEDAHWFVAPRCFPRTPGACAIACEWLALEAEEETT